jgi:sulfide:quinone oxidoreductase
VAAASGRLSVVVAGAGAAGLEALVGLAELAPERVELTLLAPDESFGYQPVSAARPFSLAPRREWPLDELAAGVGARRVRDALAFVEGEGALLTRDGDRLEFDALVVAIGAQKSTPLRRAITWHEDERERPAFTALLRDLAGGRARSAAFVVPPIAGWPMAAYELALLAAAQADKRRLEVHLITSEPRPLAIFGEPAGKAVAELLIDAGVELHLNSGPVSFEAGKLMLTTGEGVECDRAIALPIPSLADIPGLPQDHHRGLIPIGRFCNVLGSERVFAAGDATWFPIKQGGLAAQQADSAASAIAALAGAPVDPQPFRPVLRGALLTAGGPRYLRAVPDRGESTVARAALWWPPSKVAGRLLAPYLAAKSGYPRAASHALADLNAPPGNEAGKVASGHADVVDLALSSADVAASEHDYPGALRWLEVAEDLELYLPPDYELRRMSWQELAERGT